MRKKCLNVPSTEMGANMGSSPVPLGIRSRADYRSGSVVCRWQSHDDLTSTKQDEKSIL